MSPNCTASITAVAMYVFEHDCKLNMVVVATGWPPPRVVVPKAAFQPLPEGVPDPDREGRNIVFDQHPGNLAAEPGSDCRDFSHPPNLERPPACHNERVRPGGLANR